MKKLTVQQAHWTLVGLVFGYPECCIKEFLTMAHMYGGARKLNGTGYIPCVKCNAEFTERELADQINKHRFKSEGLFLLPEEQPLYFIYGTTELGRIYKEVNLPMSKEYAEHMCAKFNYAYAKNRVNVKFHISPILDI